MSQTTKTVVFAGLAILQPPWLSLHVPVRSELHHLIKSANRCLSSFPDPLVAKSLKIVRFDEDLANLRVDRNQRSRWHLDAAVASRLSG